MGVGGRGDSREKTKLNLERPRQQWAQSPCLEEAEGGTLEGVWPGVSGLAAPDPRGEHC